MHFTRRGIFIMAVNIGLSIAVHAGESLVYFGTYTGAKSQGIYVARFDPATGNGGLEIWIPVRE